ncbi:hypothetical protein DER44DRAFT_746367 [Fusarium oxysporum]|nr:hypothetical protein DER44DRAFT_746367 [Fusarium oxysporum]
MATRSENPFPKAKQPPRVPKIVAEDQTIKTATDHGLVLTKPEDLQNKIRLIWETLKMRFEKPGRLKPCYTSWTDQARRILSRHKLLLTPALVSAVHTALCTVVDNETQDKTREISSHATPFAEFHSEVVLDQVKALVRYSRLSSECTPKSSHQQALATDDTSVSSADFRRILLVIRSCLESFMTYTDDVVKALAAGHEPSTICKHRYVVETARRLCRHS